jgi:acyl carrier protein
MTRLFATQDDITAWCIAHLAVLLDIPPGDIEPTSKFDALGLDSGSAVHFVLEIEDWLGVELVPEVVYDYPSIDALSAHLAGG